MVLEAALEARASTDGMQTSTHPLTDCDGESGPYACCPSRRSLDVLFKRGR